MAHSIDLYNKLAEWGALEFGEARHLVRTCQAAGVLPKGKRGSKSAGPQLTARHGAIFLLALAGTSKGGSRNPIGVKTAVRRLGALRCEGGVERVGDWPRLVDLFTDIVRAAIDGVPREWGRFGFAMFLNDPQNSWAEVDLHPGPRSDNVLMHLFGGERPTGHASAYYIGPDIVGDVAAIVADCEAPP